ncbi:MAG TPA: hypothetical protein VFS63_00320 [Pseudolabrys sp.]|jgi:hypothetical protein|nr:hypothetical protein [Pseudolabrys sp.]
MPAPKMPPDFYFVLVLIIKMAITACFVLAATIMAERAGPLVAGLFTALPISAGPVYVFLALDHDVHFLAQSAVASLTMNAVNAVFASVYCILAQRRSLAVSLGGSFAAWIALVLAVKGNDGSLEFALAMNAAAIGVGLFLVRPFRHTPMPALRPRWYEYGLRALLVAVLVGVVVTFSFRIGPYGSGLLAVFPVVMTSIILILHRRAGGKPTAAVLANAVLGLIGFGLCTIVFHFAVEPFGAAVGLSLALAMSLTWGMAVLFARKQGLAV